ncbi:acyl-CoA synthetase [Vibrio cholerae]|nr:acyl-CoA synthetase [Vibrio cholerae]
MKKIILGLTSLAISTGAFAGIETTYKERSLNAGVYDTQDQAYAAGFKKIEQLKALPENQLANELSVWESSVLPRKLTIDDSEVVVQSFSKQPGIVQYRTIVNLDYQYQVRDRRD